jgi:hypothetical protein
MSFQPILAPITPAAIDRIGQGCHALFLDKPAGNSMFN